MIDIEFNEQVLNFLIQGTKQGLTIEAIVEAYMTNTKANLKSYDRHLELFKFHIQFYPNYERVKNLLKKEFIMDLQSDSFYLYDRVEKELFPISRASLSSVFGTKAFQKIQDTRLHSVGLGYNPNTSTLFYETKGLEHVNLYRPAKWQFPYMYEGVPVPKTPLPDRYEKFFRHLSGGEQISYDFLIHFLSATVQAKKKPLTYLTLIGKQGVGKNTLIEIMVQVLGRENVYTFSANNISDIRFNGEFKNKKLIMFDEVHVRSNEDEDFLKNFVNPTINIEEKGKDKIEIDNYAAAVLATNDLSSVRISVGDRRYSFLDLPDKTLIDFYKENYESEMSFDVYRGEYLMESEEIKKLGEFLLSFPVNKKLIDWPLQSKTRLLHQRKSLNAWETAAIDVISPKFAGQEKTQAELNAAITEATDNKKNFPGMEKWRALSKRKPGFFEVVRKNLKDGSRPNVVRFKPLNEQPHEATDEDV